MFLLTLPLSNVSVVFLYLFNQGPHTIELFDSWNQLFEVRIVDKFMLNFLLAFVLILSRVIELKELGLFIFDQCFSSIYQDDDFVHVLIKLRIDIVNAHVINVLIVFIELIHQIIWS